MIMKAAGLTNVFADVRDTWTSVGWESVIAANPSVAKYRSAVVVSRCGK